MKQLLTSRDAEEAKKISTVKVNVFIKGIKKDTKYCEKCRISSNNRKKHFKKEVFFLIQIDRQTLRLQVL